MTKHPMLQWIILKLVNGGKEYVRLLAFTQRDNHDDVDIFDSPRKTLLYHRFPPQSFSNALLFLDTILHFCNEH